jgi:hypothetical protein
MDRMKLLSIFKALPFDVFTLKELQEITTLQKETILIELHELKKSGDVEGSRKFKRASKHTKKDYLKKPSEYVKTIKK